MKRKKVAESSLPKLMDSTRRDLVQLKHFESNYILDQNICGLYYKTITIIIMMIISDATIWSVTYDRN